MTATAIDIPDYVTIVRRNRKVLPGLAEIAADLLAAAGDLPVPVYFSVSEATQEVSFQFGDGPETFRAMAEWAERFGGTLTGEPRTLDDGRESVHCKVTFPYKSVNVELYAFVRATKASTAT
jgi:hypothetical protein